MSMIKVITPHAQDFSAPVAEMVKISSRGLIGNDRRAFEKRAGADFMRTLEHIKFAKDEIPVHMIAIGATEDYGPNRNGDGFTRECCRNYHQTFTKFARFYRDHANKDPAKSFGIVKAAAYHEPMHRIELVVALNGSKEAAERNGGLIADRELEKLAADKDIAVSMACKIPFDVCSGCGNKARTRAEYCEDVSAGGHCKFGGLRRNLGKVLDNGHVLHADNPNPMFFDISHVFRPADRIAYVSGQLEKAASAGVISGALAADQLGVTAPLQLLAVDGSEKTARQLDALARLTAAETQTSNWAQTYLASDPRVQPPLNAADIPNVKLAEALQAAAAAGVILPVRDFLTLVVKTANEQTVAAVTQASQNLFSKLAGVADIAAILENNPYWPAPTASLTARVWAEKIAKTHSVDLQNIEYRAYLSVLRGAVPAKLETEKRAATEAETELAKQYGLYKIAAFASLPDKYRNNLLTTSYCVLQNYVM